MKRGSTRPATNDMTREIAPCTSGRGTTVNGGGSCSFRLTAVLSCSFVAFLGLPTPGLPHAIVVLKPRLKLSRISPCAARHWSMVIFGGSVSLPVQHTA